VWFTDKSVWFTDKNPMEVITVSGGRKQPGGKSGRVPFLKTRLAAGMPFNKTSPRKG
jgi:hypothetical protein